MAKVKTLAKGCRCNNQVNQKYGVQVSTSFVSPELFDSSVHFDQGAF
jgi:hypothetical protein